MKRPLKDKRPVGPITNLYSSSTQESTLKYECYVEPGDEGQLISNINPEYPRSRITVTDSQYKGDEAKFIVIDTLQKRLNVQNAVLQFQPIAEVDVSYLWPKETQLNTDSNVLYWSFELSKSITQEEYNDFASDSANEEFGPGGEFSLSRNGLSIYTPVNAPINIRNPKSGLLRTRDFYYDALFDPNTMTLPLRDGRNSDVITTQEP